jgi:hypothetical protein
MRRRPPSPPAERESRPSPRSRSRTRRCRRATTSCGHLLGHLHGAPARVRRTGPMVPSSTRGRRPHGVGRPAPPGLSALRQPVPGGCAGQERVKRCGSPDETRRRVVRALVVYESFFGNTREVARAIGDGVRAARPGARIDVLSVDEAPAPPAGIDLVVVGGPTHFLGVRPGPPGCVSGWRACPAATTLPPRCPTRALAARVAGGAAPGIARRLRRRGYRLVAASRTLHGGGRRWASRHRRDRPDASVGPRPRARPHTG